MATAKVDSLEPLLAFRAALIKFADTSSAALSDAESDIRTTLIWLEREQSRYWATQVRKRHEEVERAKEALRHKQVFKSPTGGRQSDTEERKALAKAQRALEEAEQKLANVKRAIQRLHRDAMEYQGHVQHFATSLQVDVPGAIAELDRIIGVIDQYATAGAPKLATSAAATADETGMSRPDEGAPPRDWNDLRKQTPDGSTRAKAAGGLVSVGAWKSVKLTPGQIETFSSLSVERQEVNPAERVVLARDVASAERVYLIRTNTVGEADSGWYIGIVDAPAIDAQEMAAVAVADLLAMRPDFRDILTLPQGTLVVLDARGIAAVLDEQGRDLLSSSAASAPPNA